MTHQVFINFRGVEMGKTFVSHLLSSFKTKLITSYVAAEPFKDLDHKAMEQSLVAIPVISMNYANSDMWFDDLGKIIACEKIGILKAIPIFFEVNPLDILSHAARKYAATQNETLEMVRKWISGQVSGKSSFRSSDWEDDSELVDKITSFVSDFLKSSTSGYHSTGLSQAPSELENAFVLYSRIETNSFPSLQYYRRSLSLPSEPSISISRSLILDLCKEEFMESWFEDRPLFPSLDSQFVKLETEQLLAFILRSNSTVIGMFGMEGVGKTTLARKLYEEISPRYHHHVYCTPITSSSQPKFNFFSEYFQESRFHRSSDEAIKEMMWHRKVLLVADGVDDIKHLKYLMEMARWFGPGSRVIVITEDRSLLTECGVKHIYEVKCPRYEEALYFFSKFAFKHSNPLPGFEELSFRAVHIANRLPLALKMLGSFLRDKAKDEWVSTLHSLEASRDSYASEVNRYIGAYHYAPRRPIKVDRHIGVDEVNSFPLYCLALE